MRGNRDLRDNLLFTQRHVKIRLTTKGKREADLLMVFLFQIMMLIFQLAKYFLSFSNFVSKNFEALQRLP